MHSSLSSEKVTTHFRGRALRPARLVLNPSWSIIRLVLLLIVFFFIFVEPNPTSASWKDGNDGIEAGQTFQQVFWPAMILLALVAVQDRRKAVMAQIDLTLIATIVWFALTSYYAIIPDVSFRRLIFTFVVVLLVLMLIASQSDNRRITTALLFLVIGDLIARYLYVFVFPKYGIHQPFGREAHLAGSWRGQYAHKNIAGLVSAGTLLICYNLRNRVNIMVIGAIVLLQGVFLVFSHSKTALALSAVVIVLSQLIARTRNVFLCALYALVPLLIINFFTVGSLLFPEAKYLAEKVIGDASFTGRIEIWRALLSYISVSPVTGAGFQSFWQVGRESPAFRIGGEWASVAFYGHQGYLDIAVTTGLIGLMIGFLFILVRPLTDIGKIKTSRTEPLFSIYVGMWLLCLYQNGTESTIFGKVEASWIFLLIGVAGLRRLRFEEGLAGSAHPSTSGKEKPVMHISSTI